MSVMPGSRSGRNRAASLPTPRVARAKIFSASFDAGASLGLLTNPFFEISQENGTTLLSGIGSTGAYAADQWSGAESGSGAGSLQNVIDPFSSVSGFRRLKNSMKAVSTTATASFSGTEAFATIRQDIEGHFFKTLGFGTADARSCQAVWIGQVSVSGTYALSLRNSLADRSFVATVALTANTPTVVLVTIPGDMSGTWGSDNARASIVTFGVVAGSTLQAATLDAWTAGNFNTHASATNWAATTNAFVQTAYFNLFPSGVLPFTTSAQITGEALQLLLNMRRPYEQEFLRCQRYFNRYVDGITQYIGPAQAYSTTDCLGPYTYAAGMRFAPTLAVSSAGHFSVLTSGGGSAVLTAFSIASQTTRSCRLSGTVASGLAAGNATFFYSSNASATLDFNARM